MAQTEEEASDDRRCVAQTLAGDNSAFDRLVRRYAAMVYCIALRMTDHEEDARDIQQETFLRAFRHLRNFRSEASFRTWLGTITARVCLTHRARRKVRPVESLEDRHNLASGDRDLAEQVSARDEARAVQRALTVLRADDRLVLVLKCVEGFSHEEIAETLGCSVDNSRVRLYRARKAFRAAFGQEYEL